jgi:hypothetical protein
MNNDTVLAQRFLKDNPDATLVAIDNCVIPAKLLIVSMVTQQRKSLPLLTEFLLRSISLGISNPTELSQFLGFPHDETVLNRIANLAADGVIRCSADGNLSLTSIGRTRVRELVEIVPEIKKQEFLFDQCGWMLSSTSPSEKISKGLVANSDSIILPSKSKGNIDEDLITTEAVISAIEIDQTENRRLDILRIEGVIKKKSIVYIPGKILVYRSAGEKTTRVAIAVNGKLMPEHEEVVNLYGGATALGIDIEDVNQTYEISADILEKVAPKSQEQNLNEISALGEEPPQSKTSISRQAYEIGTFEHWPLMMSAITTAKERLFINSPWISEQIVNDDFLTKLEACLRRGVNTTFSYGFGADDAKESGAGFKRTMRDLESLNDKYLNFSLIRHGNTHVKQLIFDHTCVIGSFNWLSFKGDQKRKYRQEKSIVITLPGIADESYAKAIDELVSQGVMKYGESLGETNTKQHAVSISKITSGDIVDAKVKNIVNFGVFLELKPGIEGLLHLTQTGCTTSDELDEQMPKGSFVKVRVGEIAKDPTGKVRYSLTKVFE